MSQSLHEDRSSVSTVENDEHPFSMDDRLSISKEVYNPTNPSLTHLLFFQVSLFMECENNNSGPSMETCRAVPKARCEHPHEDQDPAASQRSN